MHIPKDDLQIELFYWPDGAYELDTFEPKDVLVDFYSNYHFDDMHRLLWDMFKFLLEHDAMHENSLIKYHLHLFERLNDLCTASYLIAKKYHLKNEHKSKK